MDEANLDKEGKDGKSSTPSKIETLSKEDLIKLVKKQVVLLKQTKSKNEELSKQLETHQSSKDSGRSEDNDDTAAQYQELLEAYRAVQEAQEKSLAQYEELEHKFGESVNEKKQVEKKNRALNEQLECLQLKVTTLNDSFFQIQTEIQEMKSDNQKLTDQVRVISEERDAFAAKVASLQALEEERLSTIESLKSRVESNRQHDSESSSLLREELRKYQIQIELLRNELISKELADETVRGHGDVDLDQTARVIAAVLQYVDELVVKREVIGRVERERERERDERREQAEESRVAMDELRRNYEELADEKRRVETAVMRDNEDQVEKLKLMVQSHSDTIEEMRLKEQALRDEIQVLRHEKERVTGELAAMQDGYQTTPDQADVEELQRKIEELSFNNDELGSLVDSMRERDKDLSAEIEQQRCQIEDFEDQHATEMREGEKRFQDVFVELEALKVTHDIKCNEMEAEREELEALRRSDVAVKEEMEEAKGRLKRTAEELSEELRQRQEAVSALEQAKSELELLRDEASQWQSKAGELDTLKEHLELKVAQLREQLEAALQTHEQAANAVGKDQFDSKCAELERIREELDVLRRDDVAALDEAGVQVEQLRTEATQWQTKATELAALKDQLEVRVQRLCSSMVEKDQYESTCDELETVRRELEVLRRDDAASERMVEELTNAQSQRHEAQTALEQARAQVEELRAEATQWQSRASELDSSKEQVQQLREQLETESRRLVEATERLSSGDDRPAVVEKGEYDSKCNELETLRGELDSLRGDGAVLEKVKEELADAQSQRREAQTALEQAEAQVEQLRAEATQWQTKAADLDTLKDQLEVRVQQLCSSMVEKGQYESTCNELETVREEVESLRRDGATSKALIEELADAQSQRQDAVTALEQARVQVEELRAEGSQWQAKLTGIENVKNQLEAKVQLLQDQLEAESQRLADATERLSVSEEQRSSMVDKHDYDSLVAQKEELGQRVESLSAQVVQKEVEFNQELNDWKAKCRQVEQLSTREATSGETDEADAVARQLQATCDLLKEELGKAQQDNEETKTALSNQRQQCAEMQQEIRDLEERCTRATQAVEVKVEEMAKVKKELDDVQDKMNKLKQIAVKSKKEAVDLKAKYELESERSSKLSEYEGKMAEMEQHGVESRETGSQQAGVVVSLQKRVDDLHMECQGLDEKLRQMTKTNETMSVDLKRVAAEKEEIAESMRKLGTEKKNMEAQLRIVEQKLKESEEKNVQLTEEKTLMKTSFNGERVALLAEISAEKERVQATKTDLQQAQKNAQQQSLLDLEIANYERVISSYNEKLKAKETDMAEKETEISRLRDISEQMKKEIAAASTQLEQSEERGNKLKQLLVKTKKELADAKKAELERLAADSAGRIKYEAVYQELEGYKLQLTNVVREKNNSEKEYQALLEGQKKIMATLEEKARTFKSQLDLSKTQYDIMAEDFSAYKIRAQSVLKQQKTKSADEHVSSPAESERRMISEKVAQLEQKLTQISMELALSKEECDSMKDEYDRLQERYQRAIQEWQRKEADLKERLSTAVVEQSSHQSESERLVQQLQEQNATLLVSFKEQLRSTEHRHQEKEVNLRRQLEQLEHDLARYRREEAARSTFAEESGWAADVSVSEGMVQERQQGEGIDREELESVTSQPPSEAGSQPKVRSLEELLNSSADGQQDIPRTRAFASEVLFDHEPDVSTVQAELDVSRKRINHLTELLNESEFTNVRLTEQIGVLKEEIRRLERNQERERSIHNMEYLKNVMFKFITLRSSDERLQLIPVLNTMLRLSPEETQQLQQIASGIQGDPEAAGREGWGGYLQRISRLV